MTVSSQNLNFLDLDKLNRLLKDDPKGTSDALAANVRAAIDTVGGGTQGQLQRDIDNRTRTFIHNSDVATVDDMIDQSFDRQLVGIIDKAIAEAVAGQMAQIQTEIARVVKKAVDAKLEALKGKVLALSKPGRRKK